MKYVIGMDRSPEGESGRSHLYLETEDGYEPMCGYAWNRSGGESFSIWRGHVGNKGICKTCQKRADQKLNGVPPWRHKTRYL